MPYLWSSFRRCRILTTVVISDHGFCSVGEAKVQTLPLKSEAGEMKGNHHENTLLITVNLDYEIEEPQDVFFAIMNSSLKRVS